MKIVYEGTRNKLSYIVTKVHNMITDFWLYGDINNGLTPNENAAQQLEYEIIVIEEIANRGWASTPAEWKLIKKYTALADDYKTNHQYA